MRTIPDRTADWLCGFIADLPTPFTDNDTIDHVAFARLCERQVCAGASAIVVGDTCGETATLASADRAASIRTAVAIARGRIRVIAGAGSNSTSTAIELAHLADATGADAVMSVVPYYNRPTQDGIDAHFRAIADATSLPIILHDAPARSARALADDTLLRLASSPRIIGLRDDTGDTARLARLRAKLPATFRLLTGDDAQALPYLALGGNGAVSAVANIVPQLCRGITVACRQGQMRYAATIMDMLMPLIAALPPDLMPPAVKYGLSLRALATPRVRLPLVELGHAERRRILDAMDQIWASPEITTLKWQRS
jgi:4-hydroxy-tetrahydrodipicolinate synthase